MQERKIQKNYQNKHTSLQLGSQDREFLTHNQKQTMHL